MFIPQCGNNAWSCGWSVVGIYPPSVCQNVAWEELDRLFLCQETSSSHGFRPPPVNLSHPQGQLYGEKSVVDSLLLSGNVQASCSRVVHFLLLRWLSKPCTNSETWGSFPWRTLSHLLWEDSSQAVASSLCSHCPSFISCAAILFKALESEFGCALSYRCHNNVPLHSPFRFLPRHVWAKISGTSLFNLSWSLEHLVPPDLVRKVSRNSLYKTPLDGRILVTSWCHVSVWGWEGNHKRWIRCGETWFVNACGRSAQHGCSVSWASSISALFFTQALDHPIPEYYLCLQISWPLEHSWEGQMATPNSAEHIYTWFSYLACLVYQSCLLALVASEEVLLNEKLLISHLSLWLSGGLVGWPLSFMKGCLSSESACWAASALLNIWWHSSLKTTNSRSIHTGVLSGNNETCILPTPKSEQCEQP